MPIPRILASLLLVGMLAPTTGCSFFAAVYLYEGGAFTEIADDDPPAGSYTTNDFVAGALTLEDPIGANVGGPGTTDLVDIRDRVILFSFSDGRQTFDSSNATLTQAEVQTDNLGRIVYWEVVVTGSGGDNIFTLNDGADDVEDGGEIFALPAFEDRGSVPDDAGEWRQPGQVL